MEHLEGLHAYYNKHWWCRLQMYLYFKRCHTLCNVVTLLIFSASMIVGSVWLESFVMVALTAAAAFVKMDMCRFAYITYEKTLMELKNYVRAHEFDINTFLIKMQTLDELGAWYQVEEAIGPREPGKESTRPHRQAARH